MRLRTKLLIGFSSVLLLMTITVLLSVLMLHQQNDRINDIVLNHYEKIRIATVIENERSGTAKSIRDLLLDPVRINPQEISRIQASRLTSTQAIEELLRIEDDGQRKDLLINLEGVNSIYEQDVLQVLDLLKAGKNDEAKHLFLTPKQEQVRTDIQDKTGTLQSLEQTEMNQSLAQSSQTYSFTVWLIVFFLVLALVIGILVSLWVIRGVSRSIQRVSSVMTGDFDQETGKLPRINVISNDEIGQIAQAYNLMAVNLEHQARQKEEYNEALQEQTWVETKIAEISTLFQGVQDLATFARLLMTNLSPILDAQFGQFYLAEGEGEALCLNPLAAYAYDESRLEGQLVRIGEGLVGQCAQDHQRILLQDVPKDYLKIRSGLGWASPQSLLLLPIEFEGKIMAVLEFASFHDFPLLQQKLLDRLLSPLGITLHSIAHQMQIKTLLEQSQSLTEELQTQSEELQMQHEELRSINDQLEKQYRESEIKTKELEKTQSELEEKAHQLTQSSQFKSEFLANMSHELRTPLNSLLILAQMIFENREGNLTSQQIEYAHSIHSAGKDLLNLINDILDLSKVEAGKMDIVPGMIDLQSLRNELERQFSPLAQHKGLQFTIEIDRELPKTLYTDEQRVLQVLKNLLSNAIKFTSQGNISLQFSISPVIPDKLADFAPSINQPLLAISVSDTGIGIPQEKLELIFEAFRQADGTISRKHGGTGLGLAISRELAVMLGGTLTVKSVEGEGSTFTFYLPQTLPQTRSQTQLPSNFPDHPQNLQPLIESYDQAACSTLVEEGKASMQKQAPLEGKKILIVDDDMRNVFALTTLLENHDMNVLFAENGREALEVLKASSDIDLILMDIMMPEMDGYETMHCIRQIPENQEIPILALTAKAMKNDREKCIEAGASDYISKPVNSEQLLSLLRIWLYQ